MTEEDRGKRRMARRIALAWGLFSAACLYLIGFRGLAQHELDSLVALHWAVTIISGPLIFGLFGLDVAQLRTLERKG